MKIFMLSLTVLLTLLYMNAPKAKDHNIYLKGTKLLCKDICKVG